MSHYWETEIPTVISMDLLLLELCSGPIADESLHLLGKYSNVDVGSSSIKKFGYLC